MLSRLKCALGARRAALVARRRLALRPNLDSVGLESRELLATLALASAEVRPDGRTVELKFTAPLPSLSGSPDWLPGQLEGLKLTSNTGLKLEQIGTVATNDASGLTWTATYLVQASVVTFGSTGLTLSAGNGLFRDGDGNSTASFTDFAAANKSLVDSNGFSTNSFSRGTGGVTLYVSSTYGSDARSFGDAQNPATPYKTPAAALTALVNNGKTRTGSAVRLLRGDTFAPGGQIRISGQDAAHPFVIEDYWYQYTATATDPKTRPTIVSTNSTFGLAAWGGYGTQATTDNVVIRRVALNNNTALNGGRGIWLGHGGTNWLIDDVQVRRFSQGITIEGTDGPFSEVTVLHTDIMDAWGTTRPQGFYASKVSHLLISQSLFDTNGRITADGRGRDMFSHNIYLQAEGGPAVVWGNEIRGAGSHGIQMRGGGVLAYNYFGRNALAAFISGVGGTAYKNVIEKAEDISPSLLRGAGIEVSVTDGPHSSHIVDSNIIVNPVSANRYREAIRVTQNSTAGADSVIIRRNTLANNGSLVFSSPTATSATRRMIVNDNVLDSRALLPYNMPAWTDWGWYSADRNVFPTTPTIGYIGGQAQTLDQWKTRTGTEANSVAANPAYLNPNFDLGNHSLAVRGNGTEANMVATWRSRTIGSYDSRYDVVYLYQDFANNYGRNSAPVDGDESGRTAMNTAFQTNVLANASDPNGEPLTVLNFTVNGITYLASSPRTAVPTGLVFMGKDGTFSFQPATNYVGPGLMVTYTVTDGFKTDTSTVTINVYRP